LRRRAGRVTPEFWRDKWPVLHQGESIQPLIKRPGKMRLFKSQEPNLVHYATAVTFNRVPVFRNDQTCALFIDALAATREKEPFKLIGYVVMPDHVHLLANPLSPIEIDKRWLWSEEELTSAHGGRTSALSKRKKK
jgi:hypothetical protein